MPTPPDPNATPALNPGARSLAPEHFIRANLDIFTRRGSVVASYRTKNGRRFGPYYRLAYLDNGRQRSRYLGRASRLVRRVRRLLARLQKPRNDRRQFARADRLRKTNLRRVKRHWQQTLQAYGLYARGWSARGLRALGFPRLSNWQNPSPIDQPTTTIDKQASSPPALQPWSPEPAACSPKLAESTSR